MDYDDRYLKRIFGYLQEVQKWVPNKSMYITHLLLGDGTLPGKIRRSCLQINNSVLSNFITDTSNSHEDVFQRYIRIHDRRSTFLNYIERLINAKKAKTVIVEGTKRRNLESDLSPEINQDEIYIKYKITEDFVKKVIPKNANEYFFDLYNKPENEIDFYKWSKEFLIARAKAFEYCLRSSKFKNETELDENFLWDILIVIQSVILYFKYGSENGEDYFGTALFKVHSFSPIHIEAAIVTEIGIVKDLMTYDGGLSDFVSYINNSEDEDIYHELGAQIQFYG